MSITLPNLKHSFICPVPDPDPDPVPVPDPDFRVFHTPFLRTTFLEHVPYYLNLYTCTSLSFSHLSEALSQLFIENLVLRPYLSNRCN